MAQAAESGAASKRMRKTQAEGIAATHKTDMMALQTRGQTGRSAQDAESATRRSSASDRPLARSAGAD